MKYLEGKLNLNLLKLVALISMTVDHVTKIIFKSPDSFGTEFGRVAMPLFVFLLAYNFIYNSKNPSRYLRRIFIFAAISQLPFYLALDQSILLNIFFTLGFLGITLYYCLPLIKKSTWNYYWITLVISLIFLLVRYLEIPIYFDYGLPAIFFGISLSAFLIHRSVDFACYTLLSCYFLNNSLICFLAILSYLPIFFYISWRIPWKLEFFNRYKYAFYAYYPLHLIFLASINYLQT